MAWLLVLSHGAHAIDYTDLWYDPAAAGWGVNVVQSGDLLFLTFFVYGSDGQPAWYTAQLNRDTSGDFDGYLGALYSTTGTWFALPWEPRRFMISPAGTASFQPVSPYRATLAYTVSGHPRASAAIQRLPLTRVSIEGSYAAIVSATSADCGAPRKGESPVGLTVREPPGPGAMNMEVSYPDGVACTFTAELAVSGRLYSATDASYACSDGEHGSARIDELAVTQHGLEGRWSTLASNGCMRASTFAAVAK